MYGELNHINASVTPLFVDNTRTHIQLSGIVLGAPYLFLQAETATIAIPELDFELKSGTLGGRFTTVEGLLDQAKAQLQQTNPFAVGDSAAKSKLTEFLERLTEVSNQ